MTSGVITLVRYWPPAACSATLLIHTLSIRIRLAALAVDKLTVTPELSAPAATQDSSLIISPTALSHP